jgi:hypothetical protein
MAAPENSIVPAASETLSAVRVFADQAVSRAAGSAPFPTFDLRDPQPYYFLY